MLTPLLRPWTEKSGACVPLSFSPRQFVDIAGGVHSWGNRLLLAAA
jgi:hypothetical protein